jgi:uncharacterized protein YqeY
MSESILEQVQSDTRDAMRAGDRERVGTLRMIASALQQDAKLGDGDETKALQRERKKRVEAAEAYEAGGRAEQAASERSEAEIIEAYLPDQLGDDELAAIVDEAIASSGASGPQDMGKVMGPAMAKAEGRADGKRVSALVRERLGS